MTLEEMDSYLAASREYLTRASNTLSDIGACCFVSSSLLGETRTGSLERLWAEQKYLEGLAWQGRYRGQEGLGFPPLVPAIIAGGLLVTWLGTQVYTHYTESKSTSDYYECFDRVFSQYKAAGYDEAKASEQASIVCKGKPAPDGESIIGVVKLAVYASIGIAAFYLIVKLIKD